MSRVIKRRERKAGDKRVLDHNVQQKAGGQSLQSARGVTGSIVVFFIVFGLGMILGLISKYADTVGMNSDAVGITRLYEYGMNFIKDVTTELGMWVFLGAVIAAWSRNARAAALHVFVFFAGMLLAYYVYSTMLFGFFPKHYFYRWGVIALGSPIAAWFVWYGRRRKGWIAALCLAAPMALLVALGYGFVYTHRLLQGIDLLLALILWVVLPTDIKQRLRVLLFIVVMAFLIRQFEIISRVFGG